MWNYSVPFYEIALEKIAALNRYLDSIPLLHQTAEYFTLSPLTIAGLAIGFILLLLGRLEDLILGLLGFFYPAWSSFQAIEANDAVASRQWLSYWVVYAAFSFVEIFSDVVLFWIPFYYVLKLTILLWLLAPQYKGATIIYSKVLRPLFHAHRETIESVIKRVTTTTTTSSPTTASSSRGMGSNAPPVVSCGSGGGGLHESEDLADQTVRRRRHHGTTGGVPTLSG